MRALVQLVHHLQGLPWGPLRYRMPSVGTRTPPCTIAERRYLHATVQRVPDELNTLHARPNEESTSLMTPFADSIAYVARKAGEERACVV